MPLKRKSDITDSMKLKKEYRPQFAVNADIVIELSHAVKQAVDSRPNLSDTINHERLGAQVMGIMDRWTRDSVVNSPISVTNLNRADIRPSEYDRFAQHEQNIKILNKVYSAYRTARRSNFELNLTEKISKNEYHDRYHANLSGLGRTVMAIMSQKDSLYTPFSDLPMH